MYVYVCSPLQVLNLRGLVWTAGTVLQVLPIPGNLIYFTIVCNLVWEVWENTQLQRIEDNDYKIIVDVICV